MKDMSGGELFAAERPRLVSLAYRMLGAIDDAEDVVQEAFFRLHKARTLNGEGIESPAAWLTTVVTRIALDHLRSARETRESYVGPWLPEPILGDEHLSPSDGAELSDSLSIAFLMVLERLTPRERAVFILRDVFGYEYAEVGRMLELTESNCRQVFHRARRRLHDRKRRYTGDPATHRALLAHFAEAVGSGDVDAIVTLLARDAVLWADGGGRVRAAARRPIRGADAIARFVVGIARKFGVVKPDIEVINGGPALVTFADGGLRRVVSVDVSRGRITGIYIIANPDKLRPLARALRQADGGDLPSTFPS